MNVAVAFTFYFGFMWLGTAGGLPALSEADLCGPGSQWSLGSNVCTACQAGYFKSADMATCSPCSDVESAYEEKLCDCTAWRNAGIACTSDADVNSELCPSGSSRSDVLSFCAATKLPPTTGALLSTAATVEPSSPPATSHSATDSRAHTAAAAHSSSTSVEPRSAYQPSTEQRQTSQATDCHKGEASNVGIIVGYILLGFVLGVSVSVFCMGKFCKAKRSQLYLPVSTDIPS